MTGYEILPIYCAEHGITQTEIAKECGLKRDQLHQYVNGRRPQFDKIIWDAAKTLAARPKRIPFNQPDPYSRNNISLVALRQSVAATLNTGDARTIRPVHCRMAMNLDYTRAELAAFWGVDERTVITEAVELMQGSAIKAVADYQMKAILKEAREASNAKATR